MRKGRPGSSGLAWQRATTVPEDSSPRMACDRRLHVARQPWAKASQPEPRHAVCVPLPHFTTPPSSLPPSRRSGSREGAAPHVGAATHPSRFP